MKVFVARVACSLVIAMAGTSQAATSTAVVAPTASRETLRQQIKAAGEDTSDEERSRRLESDAEAVQVLTIHRSKGVEFPIVYYPYLWEPGYIPRGEQPVFFHDPDNGDARTVDVGLGTRDRTGRLGVDP